MGYTHYFTQTQKRISPEAWAQICEDVRAITTHAQTVQDIALAEEYDEPGKQPAFTDRYIKFNGLGDEGHETFLIHRSGRPPMAWEKGRQYDDFCKTARKPYDMAVTAVLCYLASVAKTHDATSDGDAHEWTPGLAMARLALPRYANELDYPLGMLREARWVGPWISNPCRFGKSRRGAKSHPEVLFCVDGRAYVMTGGRAIHCWETHDEAAHWLMAHRQGGRLGRYDRSWSTGEPLHGASYTESWESDIWSPTGFFDEARWNRLARFQRKALIPLARDDARQPPALVRPGDFPAYEDVRAPSSIEALIAAHAA